MHTLLQKIVTYTSATMLYLSGTMGTCFAQLGTAPDLSGKGGTDLESTITDVVKTILTYVALIAVIVIIIAGLRMIISSGDEGAVDKAKKTLLWAVVGLIVIIISAGIVNLVLG